MEEISNGVVNQVNAAIYAASSYNPFTLAGLNSVRMCSRPKRVSAHCRTGSFLTEFVFRITHACVIASVRANFVPARILLLRICRADTRPALHQPLQLRSRNRIRDKIVFVYRPKKIWCRILFLKLVKLRIPSAGSLIFSSTGLLF